MSARETCLSRGTDGSRPPCCNPAHGENRGLICSHSSYSSSRLVDVVVGRLVDVLRSWLLHPRRIVGPCVSPQGVHLRSVVVFRLPLHPCKKDGDFSRQLPVLQRIGRVAEASRCLTAFWPVCGPKEPVGAAKSAACGVDVRLSCSVPLSALLTPQGNAPLSRALNSAQTCIRLSK